jgi:hypothetical protein
MREPGALKKFNPMTLLRLQFVPGHAYCAYRAILMSLQLFLHEFCTFKKLLLKNQLNFNNDKVEY